MNPLAGFTIGCDPELMLLRNDNLVSCLPILKGRKHLEEQLPSGGTVMSDNVLAEFTIPPAASQEEFEHNIRTVLGELREKVDGCQLMAIPSAHYPEAELDNEEAKRFGCDRDFDAWTQDVNTIDADEAARQTLRTGGGHIHIGHPAVEASIESRLEVVMVNDAVNGVVATALDRFQDSHTRRQLYGKAGAHRPKPYGVEYRVPSNFWVSKPELVNLAYELTQTVVETWLDTKLEIVEAIGKENIISIINESQTQKAISVIENIFPKFMSKDLVRKILGCEFSVEDRDIAKSWKFA